MTDLKQAAVQLAVIRELKARVAEAETRLKEVFVEALEPGDAKQATLEDGTKLGRVGYNNAAVTPKVTDERALLKWVKRHRPDEVVQSVRLSYINTLKASAKEHGVPVTPDGDIVPGIELSEGTPYVQFYPVRDAGAIIAQHWQEHLVLALKALPGGESDA